MFDILKNFFGNQEKQTTGGQEKQTLGGQQPKALQKAGPKVAGKMIHKKEPTLAELRKQDRSKPPRFKVYPFTMEVKNGVTIPYAAWPQEIVPFLQKDMAHYEAGMIALAWKGCEESFEIMFKELRNKDYYRRRLALANMEFHDLFPANIRRVLKEALLDGHELVVTLAVKFAAYYKVRGLHEELQMVLECWPDDLYLQKTCKVLLALDSVHYADIVQRNEADAKNRHMEEQIYAGSSQCILQERWDNPVFGKKYEYLMKCYFPDMSEQDMRKMADKFAEEGCGYAALATTMTLHFANKPDVFRKHYGCDLVQDGEYITDAIMLDFYCMTDEPNRGMSLKQMEERFCRYCGRYGIAVQLNTLEEVNVERFAECSKTGYVLLFGSDITMYYKKYQPSHVKGWHVMNVCDVDGEDTATVVSWGRKYTLKLEELKKDCKFVWVRYGV